MHNLHNPFSSTFTLFLREFYDCADLGFRAVNDYAKAKNFDMALIGAHAGILSVLPCAIADAGYFDFDAEGQDCLVFEVIDEDAATTIDLCAFSIANPSRFGTANGEIGVLGMANVVNPATWAFDKKLRVHRRPLEWLQDGCAGTVILDHRQAPACLAGKLGDLIAEDAQHARELRSMLCTPSVAPNTILFPQAVTRRAA